HDESRAEGAGLLAWQGGGAVRVHRSECRGETAALRRDRVRPGTPLAQLLTWPERDEVIAGVAHGLWRPPRELMDEVAAAGFRPLSQMCAWWADEAQRRADDGSSPLPCDLVAHGLQLFRELPRQWDGEARSEERRVGKECRSRRSADHEKKTEKEGRRMSRESTTDTVV